MKKSLLAGLFAVVGITCAASVFAQQPAKMLPLAAEVVVLGATVDSVDVKNRIVVLKDANGNLADPSPALLQNIETYLKEKGIKIELPTNNKKAIIQVPKSTIYRTPNNPIKMYLLKGDEVEVLSEKDGWLHIRYYGKKTIEGWIKKTDVSN